MKIKKESDSHLRMDKKETSLKRSEEKNILDNKNTLGQKTKNSTKKGLQTYRDQLESDDTGIESANKMTEQTYKLTKKTGGSLKQFHKKRKENKLKKSDEENIKATKSKLGIEKKRTKSKLSEGQKQDNFLKKVVRQPKKVGKKAVTSVGGKGLESYKQSLKNDDDGVKVGTKGTQLVKDGTKSIMQASKARRTKKGAVKRLRGRKTKLRTNKITRQSKLKKGQKALQKNRIMRKNIAKRRPDNPVSLTSIARNSGTAIRRMINRARIVIIATFRRIISTKVMAWVGAIIVKLIPVIFTVAFIFGIVFLLMSLGGGATNQEIVQASGMKGLDPEVEEWRPLVKEVAEEENMTEYIELALAIIQVETGGTESKDIMQSSESAGHEKDYIQDERESVEQGLKYIQETLDTLESYDEKYLEDMKLIAQTYNFGLGFAGYVGSSDYDGYNIEISEEYSKGVVAVSFGNTTGEIYPYENQLSLMLDKPYLYIDGGNFLYGEEIGQYVVEIQGDGEMLPPVQPMVVTSHFGHRQSPGGIGSTNHKGIDLACEGGTTPIGSLMSGEVVKSKYVNGLGNTVIVQHEESLYTTYAHMSILFAEKGEKVNPGETLGICGTTGTSTAPHLHLEISSLPHQNQVNPYPHIKHLIGD